jgi:hypothetical protein
MAVNMSKAVTIEPRKDGFGKSFRHIAKRRTTFFSIAVLVVIGGEKGQERRQHRHFHTVSNSQGP